MIAFSLPQQIRGSFGAKLLLGMILLISGLSLLFNFFLARLHYSSYHQHLVNTGTVMAGVLAESIKVEVFAEDVEGLKPLVDAVFNQDEILGVGVFNQQKERLYHREKKEDLDGSSGWHEAITKFGATPALVTETKDALIFRYSLSSAIAPGSSEGLYFRNVGHEAAVQDIGYVSLVFSSKNEAAVLKHALSQVIFSTSVFLLFGVALTYLVVRRMTSPLSALLRKVRASVNGQHSGDDVDLLAKTFDAQFNELRETVATISMLTAELEVSNRELSADILRRETIEASLRQRDHILATVNHAAEKLVEGYEFEGFVKELVDELGEVLNVGTILVLKHHLDADGDLVADIEHEWISEEAKANIATMERQNLSYNKQGFESWRDCFVKGEMVSGNSVDMPLRVKSWLDDYNIKSVAIAPIMVGEECWGTIGLTLFDREQHWSELECDALQTAARMIGAALHREQIMKELDSNRAQLAHAGRLTAMGEMASGMAHEINQPLTVINLSADVCTAYFNRNMPDAPEAEAAEDIRLQVKKVARIVDNMRVFSRRSSEELKHVNLASPLDDALTFFRAQFREYNIELQEDISGDLPDVKTDSQKFEQIVVNLLSNARYAVNKRADREDGFSRKIEVRLYPVSLSPEQIGGMPESFYSGQAIVFEVQDNGLGMDETVKSRCLEPFFTTKEVGEGTGLGLSVSHGLMRELGLSLEITSQPHKGSLFRVFIPVNQGEYRV